ncbi:MAG TPA: T9SS type A sorting domain-containing protein, partial [Saprospiraceae bacterium]|nr:T9SS type A sorting domain-containing protein [Saprospiraceae bacterium]
ATVSAEDTIGSTTCTVSWKTFQYSTTVHVVDAFAPLVPPMQKVKVALVIIDPPIAAENGLRFHERFGWDDPHHLANALRDSLNSAGGGAVDYDITSIIDDTTLYASFQGVVISIDSMYRLFLEPGWATFHALEQLGNAFYFNYNGLLAAHDFCSLSDAGEIDEVWVYSMPFTGMYESRLTGQEAFWYNSPPLDGNPCVGQLPIMGFNYERGVAEAMHSFGHRVESAMAHTFGRWDYNAPVKNDWEKFSSYDKVAPGEAHCGNIHYPPNALSDYDYGNTGIVETKAENWERYPFLFDFSSSTDCQAWECSQLGFMSWWYHHLPHFTCKNSSGILNNWWPYIVDYLEGKAFEKNGANCNCDFVETSSAIVPVSDLTAMIYPNPGNGMVFLKATGMKDIENIAAVDLFGRVVRMTVTSLSDSMIQIGTEGIQDGLYFLILTDAFSHQRIIPFTIVHP